MAGMPLAKRTTEQRGYGWGHIQARRVALAQLSDGDPCAQCMYDKGVYHPMYRAAAAGLDLSHNDTRTGYIGLSWRRCNRRDGAQRGNRRRGQLRHHPDLNQPTQNSPSRNW